MAAPDPCGRIQADPGQDVAAKPFDDRHAFADGFCPRAGSRGLNGAGGQAREYLLDQAQGLPGFLDAYPEPRVDIALVQHRDLEIERVVRSVAGPAPRVAAPVRCAAYVYAGADGAVLQGRGVVVEFDEPAQAMAYVRRQGTDAFGARGVQVGGDAARL